MTLLFNTKKQRELVTTFSVSAEATHKKQIKHTKRVLFYYILLEKVFGVPSILKGKVL